MSQYGACFIDEPSADEEVQSSQHNRQEPAEANRRCMPSRWYLGSTSVSIGSAVEKALCVPEGDEARSAIVD